ncbi:MAG TPA: hypothetical protein VI685_18085 [Candidatus Angelobacter sp.]
MRRVWFLLSLLAGIALFSGLALAQVTPPLMPPTPPPPPPVDLDHFRCYFIPNQPVLNIPIMLQDQFDAALPTPQSWENINQLTLGRICATVYKHNYNTNKDYPQYNPNHHLTMYQINPQPIIPRWVWAVDQFYPGAHLLEVSDARFLLVPTGKVLLPSTTPPSPSPDLDHYKCYQACDALSNVPVRLKDQFYLEGVTTLWPVLFCNPVVKVRPPAPTTPIQKPNDHLTCYATTPSAFPGLPNPNNPNGGIYIWNQFEKGPKTVQKPDLLCVPTTKWAWTPVPAPAGTTTAAASVKPTK